MMTKTKKRPIHLDLTRIHFPINAIASFGHRVSGLLLFLATPWCIYLLDLSLEGPEGFARVQALLGSGFARFVIFVLAWGLLHHLFAGIRCMVIDLDRGVGKPVFQQTAWGVLAAAPLVAALLVGVLL